MFGYTTGYLWAVVDTAAADKRYVIHRIGTGFPLKDGLVLGGYLNTTVAQGEPYVWHWFWDIID